MLKVVLAVPEFSGPRSGVENLGICYVDAAITRIEGISCTTINQNCTLENDQIVEAILRERPDIIGLSATTEKLLNNINNIVDRLNLEDVPIIAGGHYLSFVPLEAMEKIEKIDICVVGEGELTMEEIVRCYMDGKEIHHVKGIVYRDGNKIITNDRREAIANLDDIPIPRHQKGLAVYSVAASRGCYTTCSFCSVPQFFKRIPGRNFRLRSVSSVADEVKTIAQIGARAVSFVDDVFLLPGAKGAERAKEIADVMSAIGILWAFGCRTPELTEEIIDYCAPRGLCNVGLGIESGSDRVLSRLSKRASMNDNRRAIELCQTRGVSLQPYFIMFEPDMVLDDLRQNIEFLASFGLLWPSFASNELDPYPGTPAYDFLVAEGRIVEEKGRRRPRYADQKLANIKPAIQRALFKHIPEEVRIRKRQFEAEVASDVELRRSISLELRKLSDETRNVMLSFLR